MKTRRFRKSTQARKILEERGLGIAVEAIDALSTTHTQAFMIYGSLLGLIREGHFLKHDDDLDIGVIVDNSFSWKSIETALNKKGFSKCREFTSNGKITEQAYNASGLTFDIFGFFPIENSNLMKAYHYTFLPKVKYNSPTGLTVKKIEIPSPESIINRVYFGYRLPVASNAEAQLAAIYGTSWRIPDKSWVSGDKNFEFLMDVNGNVTFFD